MAESFFFGGLLGFLLGVAGRRPEWEKFAETCDNRLWHMTYFRVIIPYGAYSIGEVVKHSFGESYYAYLFGLPNSSVALSAKMLENALKEKYGEVEKTEPTGLGLAGLLGWAEKKLNLSKGPVGHAIRLLRNELMHEERVVQETEALETLKHASLVLNELYPYPNVSFSVPCPTCGAARELITLKMEEAYIGYVRQMFCSPCQRAFTFTLTP